MGNRSKYWFWLKERKDFQSEQILLKIKSVMNKIMKYWFGLMKNIFGILHSSYLWKEGSCISPCTRYFSKIYTYLSKILHIKKHSNKYVGKAAGGSKKIVQKFKCDSSFSFSFINKLELI